jgi:hypothetical protein
MTSSSQRPDTIHGILLITLFACAASYIGQFEVFRSISLSPMIIGIVLGMLYANSLRSRLPATWVPGIQFCSKKVLRLGIILYGFRLTFSDIASVGLSGIIIDAIIVTLTILGGVMVGRLLKMDRDTALLTSVGSGICGAAAVLGAESTIHAKPYKTAVAVATVVIFGTISMFLYPAAYSTGELGLTPTEMGIFSGATLHEVAHAVGAGGAMGPEVEPTAVIVKMIRVMMLVPVLLILGWWVAVRARRSADEGEEQGKGNVTVPWFAIWFLAVICFNSLVPLPEWLIEFINQFDTFLLTMAMCALGAETTMAKFRQAGAKPFILATVLWIWLLGGGYLMSRYLAPIWL